MIARQDPRGGLWALSPLDRRRLAEIPGLRGRFLTHGRLPTHDPLLSVLDVLQAKLTTESPDLPALCWWSLAYENRALRERVVPLLVGGTLPLPTCPWPGRRMPSEADVIASMMSRTPLAVALGWVAALADASTDSCQAAIDDLRQRLPPPPPTAQPHRFELAMAGLAVHSPERFEALVGALGPAWTDPCERARVLRSQIAEAERGPLHPELARIRESLMRTSD